MLNANKVQTQLIDRTQHYYHTTLKSNSCNYLKLFYSINV